MTGRYARGLAIQLEQSLFLSMVSGPRTQKALRLMGQPAEARLTPELVQEICEQYRLGLRVKKVAGPRDDVTT